MFRTYHYAYARFIEHIFTALARNSKFFSWSSFSSFIMHGYVSGKCLLNFKSRKVQNHCCMKDVIVPQTWVLWKIFCRVGKNVISRSYGWQQNTVTSSYINQRDGQQSILRVLVWLISVSKNNQKNFSCALTMQKDTVLSENLTYAAHFYALVCKMVAYNVQCHRLFSANRKGIFILNHSPPYRNFQF